MTRLLTLTALLALGGAADAQPLPPVRLTLAPMAEPTPALKYPLLPELRERTSGNALLRYYRAFSPEWQYHRRDHKVMEQIAAANAKPLRDLDRAEVERLSRLFGAPMLREIDRGARRTYCDWELIDRMREDGIGLLLPDVQGFREIASLLQFRARQELLAGKFDQAARTLQTGLAMARHVSEGPTLIHGLVGIACGTRMLDAVDDWIDRPGAPNLYWALTDLPRPLVSLRTDLQGEYLFIDHLFPGYRELLVNPAAPLSSARVQTSLQQYARMLELEGGAKLGSLLLVMRAYPAAKRFLRAQGRSAEEIEKMPAAQAVFLYEVHNYDVAYSELRKWTSLPYAEAAPRIRQFQERLRDQTARGDRFTLTYALLPAIDSVLSAQARLDRKAAALRCVEALRLHAAAHGGKLPARLADITDVPIPLDPFTGKPFVYRLDGDRVTLSGLPGEKDRPHFTLRYELTLRTAKEKK
jgi:hypothetical protein